MIYFQYFFFLFSEETDGHDSVVENIISDTSITTTRKVVKIRDKSGPKKYECNICGKVLSCRGNLNKHMVLHDESKKFECPDCQAKFNQQRDLNNHKMQKHTGHNVENLKIRCCFCAP